MTLTFKQIPLSQINLEGTKANPNFEANLESYLEKLQNRLNQDETNKVANTLQQFFTDLGFSADSQHKQSGAKGNSNIDLALLKNGNVKVIIEAKKKNNTKEMFSSTNLNCRALHECVLYYLRERDSSLLTPNTSLSFIIITDFHKFYIFKSSEFRRIFEKSKPIKELYKNFSQRENIFAHKATNQDFYDELSKIIDSENFLDSIDRDGDLSSIYLEGLHFDLSKINKKDLQNISRILSPEFLYDEPRIDPNALNERFYLELLHILGLKEIESRKITIDDSQQTSFAKHILDKLQNLKSSQKESQDELFEKMMRLIIIWLNRILFLKLIESKLLEFNPVDKKDNKDKNLAFLTSSKIKDFTTLENLFFEVLAKDYDKRTLNKEFAYLPYLNSSLFTKESIERDCPIGYLDSNLKITLYKNSIIKDSKNIQNNEIAFLTYLFDFLDSYSFGLESNQDSKDSHTIIKSSVLGSVFERLNGYKEGSFYTPSFITSYMCAQSIDKIILARFNEKFSFTARNLIELKEDTKDYIRSFDEVKADSIKQEFKDLLLSIRICDPSVGSGHFLVSALNHLVKVHYDLKLALQGYNNLHDLEIKDDEIILLDSSHKPIIYTRPQATNQSHELQKELFHLKKQIIESCLFGVDINPISCHIAQLRLWIELLKSTYYKDIENGTQDLKTHRLETLPNIDINIKCGNSLVAYFDTKQSLSHYPNIQAKIDDYKNSVKKYKQGFYENKSELADKISTLHKTFKDFCFSDRFKSQIQAFQKQCDAYDQKYGNYLADNDKNLAIYVKAKLFTLDFDEKEAKEDFIKLQNAYDSLFNLESNKPFEWRFEFPEVLDSDGNFLGFDLIIGNPPYIRHEAIKELKPHLSKSYKIYKGTSDIYTYFYELGYKILKVNGMLSFITSNKWTRAGYGEALKGFIIDNTQILSHMDFNGIKVFDSASVDTSITSFKKATPKDSSFISYRFASFDKSKDIESNNLIKDSISQSICRANEPFPPDMRTYELKIKIESIGTPLKDWDISIYRGITTGYNEAFIIDSSKRDKILESCKSDDERKRTQELIKPILRGRDIKRYSYEWVDLWLIFIPWHFPNTDNPKSMQENEQDFAKLYPTLYNHFLQHKDNLMARNKDETGIRYEWYCLQRWAANYHEEFNKPKIVWNRISGELCFSYDNQECFILDSMFMITCKNEIDTKYLLACLNSNLSKQWIKANAATLGEGVYGAKIYIEKLPIPQITESHKDIADEIIALVDKILESKAKDSNTNTSELESKIDSLVYKLYGLSDDEIRIIESK